MKFNVMAFDLRCVLFALHLLTAVFRDSRMSEFLWKRCLPANDWTELKILDGLVIKKPKTEPTFNFLHTPTLYDLAVWESVKWKSNTEHWPAKWWFDWWSRDLRRDECLEWRLHSPILPTNSTTDHTNTSHYSDNTILWRSNAVSWLREGQMAAKKSCENNSHVTRE